MAYQFNNVASIEPVSAADGILKGNTNLYNVLSGCGPTYSAANMTVDCAAGSITHNGSSVTVAGGSSFWTVVADATNPRWTWLALDNTGAAVVVSGTAATKPAVPALGDRVAVALLKVEAAQTIAANIATKIDKRIPGAISPYTTKYKTSNQVFTTSTTYANITATSGDFAFSVAPNGIYLAQYCLSMAYGGTGGLKLQLTGPASPTLVQIDAIYYTLGTSDYLLIENSATAFSSGFAGYNSAGTTGSIVPGSALVTAFIVNGPNSGTVTLQGAQNSSNSTTTFQSGSWMVARKVG